MEVYTMLMALIGSMIGECSKKEVSSEGLVLLFDILASTFLSFLFILFLDSFNAIDEKILLGLSGFLGYLGERYTKELCLKILNRSMKKD